MIAKRFSPVVLDALCLADELNTENLSIGDKESPSFRDQQLSPTCDVVTARFHWNTENHVLTNRLLPVIFGYRRV